MEPAEWPGQGGSCAAGASKARGVEARFGVRSKAPAKSSTRAGRAFPLLERVVRRVAAKAQNAFG
jgi:hypothetical protein